MATPLIKKLGIKAEQRLLVLRAPEGYLDALRTLPAGVRVDTAPSGTYDLVQLFVGTKAAAAAHVPLALAAVKPDGLLWLSYPKQSSPIKTDINRDTGWDAAHAAGWRPVRQISLDATWSALRFKPAADVKARGP